MGYNEKRRLPVRALDRYGTSGFYFNYDATRHFPPQYKETVIDPLAILLSRMPRGTSLLDVASGKGEVARYLSRVKHINIVQSDISRIALGKSRGMRVRAMAEELPFRNRSFDFIHMKDGITHIEDQVKLFREFKRILKPRGGVILTAFTDIANYFMVMLKNQEQTAFPLPYFNKDQYLKWSDFLEGLKIIKVSPPMFKIFATDVIKNAQDNGFILQNYLTWNNDWQNRDWTLTPQQRFTLILQKDR